MSLLLAPDLASVLIDLMANRISCNSNKYIKLKGRSFSFINRVL